MLDNQMRIEAAAGLLKDMGIKTPHYLGHGSEGVVFHDEKNVYKVLMPVWYKGHDRSEYERRLLPFMKIDDARTLYQIKLVISHGGCLIQVYEYEKSVPCDNYSLDEAVPFLVECWAHKIIIKDCKPKNFIRLPYGIKLVDADSAPYDDNLFLNMCVRMYLYATCLNTMDASRFHKLVRSSINNFDLPELVGARDFVNRVFAAIIYAESKREVGRFVLPTGCGLSEIIPFTTSLNLERIRFSKLCEGKWLTGVHVDTPRLTEKNYFAPEKLRLEFARLQPISSRVSLLIKTCAQDADTIEQNVRHIVWQLSSPNPFSEIVVSVDSKESGFLRPFNSEPSLAKVVSVLRRLADERVIDRYVLFDAKTAAQVNERWFGVSSKCAHSAGNVPVSSQLFAFEQCTGDYVLQCDSDVMVGRRDHSHSYLSDMIRQLRKNEDVLSVGFNICNEESKDYFGFESGGFVPEVRMCLFDRKRLFASRPWPNAVGEDGKLTLSWYRSLQKAQADRGKCSIRGGDCRTFYIHPQNYRKTKAYSWLGILDRVEQGHVPAVQYGKFDCEGSFRSWCRPLRNEKMVVVSCFRNVVYDRFLRMWCSLMSQEFQDFGVILVDDCSDNGLPCLIDSLIRPYADRITFIKNRSASGRLESEFIAIRYFVGNPDAVIVMLDGDDALIGKGTLADVWNRYAIFCADVTVGRVHQTYRLQPHYRYPVNFVEPRKTGGNVWQHLKSFRKYLFDSIPLPYLKWKASQHKLQTWKWYERCDDYAIMVPVVEMCSNPVQMDRVCYFYERDAARKDDGREIKEACIKDILSRPALSPSCMVKGRKRFITNDTRVELDITYSCNLRCRGCNRSCAQSPTDEAMTIDDIRRFVNQSISTGKKWGLINVLGGEPTLHKDFLEIVRILQFEYADSFSPQTTIQITSNGYTALSRGLCEKAKLFKNVQVDEYSTKASPSVDYFTPFNDAPMDDPAFANADYACGCWVAAHCGIGVNCRGYYACAVCGGIDRVLGQDHAIKELSDATPERFSEQRAFFCRYCGNFKHYAENAGEFIPRCEKAPFCDIISPTWQKIYGKGSK